MNNKQLAEFLATAKENKSEAEKITKRLLMALKGLPEEVHLKQLAIDSSVAYQTIWGRVTRGRLKPCGQLTAPTGHRILLYRREDLLEVLGAKP